MNKEEYPFWLKVAFKLPLKWRHWIRKQANMAEYWSTILVCEDGNEIITLIENRTEPDFVEFDRRLDIAEKAWGIYDSEFETFKVRKRMLEFKREHKKDKHEKT